MPSAAVGRFCHFPCVESFTLEVDFKLDDGGDDDSDWDRRLEDGPAKAKRSEVYALTKRMPVPFFAMDVPRRDPTIRSSAEYTRPILSEIRGITYPSICFQRVGGYLPFDSLLILISSSSVVCVPS